MIICDTGPLVAALNRKDADHTRCVDLLEKHPGPLLVPGPVLTEVCYLLESRVGAHGEAAFLAAVADGELQLVGLTQPDLRRMVELVKAYADFPLGAVDASVVAIAERYGCADIATLDIRHFSTVRPRHVPNLNLLPT
ncbi:PIN domain-containing protein [Phytohabitans flavus]|uniref:Ribonuclease VapC n=1 Tax=Phytohabitans flavus TaxID=1076124 RepID=A0A6F8XXZ8_9ACTN|nr:PIN domain-containing protein [Phytohabitans flavus]BCB78601.1 pilus biogenesis protein [Phytohabitans flavus]